jgi:hypothetical protein
MLTEKQNKIEKKIYIRLFIIAFAVAFSSTYNPLNFRRMHVDSAVYVTVSQGIIRGQLPYRDIVDNKGPLAYLVNVPGLFLGGFTGIWITELLFLFVSVLFAYKTALFFTDSRKAIAGTLSCFLALLPVFTVNAGTEEYSLPFLMISLYIFTRYYFSQKEKLSSGELAVSGSCFACAVLIRLNMFPLWAGFCIVIFAESVINRRFALLGKYVCAFCFGIIIIFVPVFLYLKLNGIFDAFLELVVFGGAARGFGGGSFKETVKNFYILINRNYSFIPLFFGLFFVIAKFRKPYFSFYCGYTLSCFLMALFLSFSGGGTHYNMVIIPFFVPVFTSLTGLLFSVFPDGKIKNSVLVFFICIVFSEGLVKYCYDLSKIVYDNSGSQMIRAGKMIDENTKPGDKILSLYNAYIYPFTRREAASKYCYQGSGLKYIQDSQKEFLSDILENKPAVIAVFTAEGADERVLYTDDWYSPIIGTIYEIMDKDYRLLSDENGYRLFIRN